MSLIDLTWNHRKPEQDKHFFINSPKCLGLITDIQVNRRYVPYPPNDDLFINNNSRAFVNSCPHKHAKLLKNSCEAEKKLVCPIHKWSFDEEGNFIMGRGFEKCKDKNLIPVEIFKWQGFLMAGSDSWTLEINEKLKNDLKYFENKNYVNWKRETMIANFDWKIFYETFLDLYHVRSYHPGLRNIVDVNQYDYSFGDGWSCQYAYLNSMRTDSSSKKTDAWLDECEKLGLLDDDSFKILWLGIYPNVMLESYPGCTIISQVYPYAPGKHANTLEFYFDKSILDRSPQYAQLTYDCWMETAREDEIIGKLMQQGRDNLIQYKKKVPQFDHPSEETANTHWFEWMRDKEQKNDKIT